jgi:hypothetical protein
MKFLFTRAFWNTVWYGNPEGVSVSLEIAAERILAKLAAR